MQKKIILTGDRPTGKLHLGHYVGSLSNRVKLQNEYEQFILIADLQALTDNAERPEILKQNIIEVTLDYLAVGIDPKVSTIFIQSQVPELTELTFYFMNLVTVPRLQRNPTVKTEIKQKNFGSGVPVGFFVYPISQAADITLFKANLVPVGQDQLPMIEQTNEIVRKFNSTYEPIFVEAEALVPKDAGRLPGIDGQAKMGKSLGNAIYLSDDADTLQKKIMSMFTDPTHLKVEDPGKIEGNTVFTYLDYFASDKKTVDEMKEHYQKGGLGDVKVKKYLNEILQELLKPIRERRQHFAKDISYIENIVRAGTEKAKVKAGQTMQEVRKAMKLNYF
ncbi:tryptophan--tRNA ligase [Candidatus Dependentiae bacterium]|nr:tryptophan--tRNA ligase [Candidatus Dependentiae bacterium]MBU4387009.1 tryptophan--tRNA ligase [Candidatus Dependentiae bacterium]MCG2756090.1 tryptophan--tRNA ligase [Candidatus Dependentiae bacterium]